MESEEIYSAIKAEVLKYDSISIDHIWRLAGRFCSMSKLRFFNEANRSSYFRGWVISLEREGIIEETSSVGMWKVNRPRILFTQTAQATLAI